MVSFIFESDQPHSHPIQKQAFISHIQLKNEVLELHSRLHTLKQQSFFQGENKNAKRIDRFIEWLPADVSAFRLFCNIIADPGLPEITR